MNRPTALVTGASSGIGTEFARQLAQGGHDVVLVARDTARLEALAKELGESYGGDHEVLAADLTDRDQVELVAARCSDAERPIDLLINNAGYGSFGRFTDLDVEVETREIELNVLALTRLTHAAAAAMAARGRGGILNVSSLAGYQPGPFNATYAATKAFVTSFTEAVHEEMKGTGVRVTVLCPGFTRTEFQERSGADAERVPGFLWHSAAEVAAVGLKAVAKGSAVAVPGAVNRVTGAVSSVSPHAITRRAYALIVGKGVK